MPRLDRIRHDFFNGDLVFRVNPASPIAQEGKTSVSHVMTAIWRPDDVGGTLNVGEAREFLGCRVISLRDVIRRYPGQIIACRPNCSHDIRERAATIAYRWCTGGHGYDYKGLLRCMLMHAPLLRRALHYYPDVNTGVIAPWNSRKFCSFAAAWFYQRAIYELGSKTEWRLVRELDPQFTEPGEIFRSGNVTPLFNGEALSL